jgi:hypothetical protein
MSDIFDDIPSEDTADKSGTLIPYAGDEHGRKFTRLDEYVEKKTADVDMSLKKIKKSPNLLSDVNFSLLRLSLTDNYAFKDHCRGVYTVVRETLKNNYAENPELVHALDAIDSAYKVLVAAGIRPKWMAELSI